MDSQLRCKWYSAGCCDSVYGSWLITSVWYSGTRPTIHSMKKVRMCVCVCVCVCVWQTTTWSRRGHQPPNSTGNQSTWGGHVWQNRSCSSAFVGQFSWSTLSTTFAACHCNGYIDRVLFQYSGNLPELPKLPGLTPVLVRKRTANPVEVVATPVTEMLQCDTPYWSRGIFYVLCLLLWAVLNYNYTFSQKCTY